MLNNIGLQADITAPITTSVIQVFLRNPSSSSEKYTYSAEVKKRLKNVNVYVHSSYMVNLCNEKRIHWMHMIIAEDMKLAKRYNCKGFIIHMGDCPIKMIEEITKIKRWVPLLLENNCKPLKDFGKVVKATAVGVCLDTCHLFSAGYAINTMEGFQNTLKEYKKYVGDYSTIKLIHLNDSKHPIGSGINRHESIGKGYIKTMCHIVLFAQDHNIPLITETNTYDIPQVMECLTLKSNTPIAKILDLLEEFRKVHRGSIKSVQYAKAIQSIKQSGITHISRGEDLKMQWVGKGIIAKVNEFIKTGKVAQLEDLQPVKLLTKVYGIGLKKANELIAQGITTIDQLKNVKLTHQQQLGLKYYNQSPIPRKESEKIKRLIEKEFNKLYDGSVELAGSYYRGKETSNDIDILLAVKNDAPILKEFINHLKSKGIITDMFSSNSVIIKGRQIDFRQSQWEYKDYYMLYFGSGDIHLRQLAKSKGYKLNEKGLFKKKRIAIPANKVEEFLKSL